MLGPLFKNPELPQKRPAMLEPNPHRLYTSTGALQGSSQSRINCVIKQPGAS